MAILQAKQNRFKMLKKKSKVPEMFSIHARIAFHPIINGGFSNAKVAAYDFVIFAIFEFLEGVYDLAFGKSGCFHRVKKLNFFSF
jgi:hypothetical protein